MATSGQTLNDRINAARYALAGQGLARCVCKATTEEVIGPKKKHLDYLLACTHEPNVSIPQLANLLIERTNHIYWVVVFKALVTVHHLMSYGNERFIQYLASSNYSFELSTFLDKTSARDFSMSNFIRRYSRYINEKALSYRLLAFDLCKVNRGKDGILRCMPIDRLLKTLPILQNQLDALLEFDCSANDLNNGVINACFMLLFRDLIGLFACHNDGIINLLEKYFTLNRKMTKEAFDCYKKFLVRMDKVSDFLRVAEVVGIDKDDIPDLKKVPNTLIETLERHLQDIESNKKILKQQSGTSKSIEFSSVLGNLTPPTSRRSHSPGTPFNSTASASTSSQNDDALNNFKDEEVRKALEEEARVLSQYGTDGLKTKPKNNGLFGSPKQANQDGDSLKFAVTSTVPKSVDDIFGDANSFGTLTNNGHNQIDNNGLTFDNLNTTSGSSAGLKQKLDADMIKSTIKSATTTLEKSSAKGGTDSSGSHATTKKASDDLFSLLEAPTVPEVGSSVVTNQPAAPIVSSAFSTVSKQTLGGISSFGSSPYSMALSNGQLPILKPGNPFPNTSTDFDLGLGSGFANNNLSGITPVQGSVGSVFKSATPTANYTNLGLDNFGDLLQPISSSGKASSNSGTNIGNNKSTFNSNSGLTNTGLFKGDLDTTLANLAQNLTFEAISKTKK